MKQQTKRTLLDVIIRVFVMVGFLEVVAWLLDFVLWVIEPGKDKNND